MNQIKVAYCSRVDEHGPSDCPDMKEKDTTMTQETIKRWVARCECYNGHNSASGRCRDRNVNGIAVRPDAGERGAVYCEDCFKVCWPRLAVNV